MNKTLYKLHRWTGLTVGALLLVQAFTGLMLTHKEPLAHWFGDAVRGGDAPRAGLDRIIANVRAVRPDGRIDRIIYPQEHDLPLIARIVPPGSSDFDIVTVDPVDARVIDSGPLWRFPLQLFERIHVALLMGDTGKIILFLEAAGLLFMAITGLILWWPRAGRFVASLTVHWRGPSLRILRDLHVVPGVLTFLFIIASAFTGASLVAPYLLRPVVAAVATVAPKVEAEWSEIDRPATILSWQDALDRLKARFPDGKLRQIRFAGKDDRILGVVMIAEDAVNPRAHNIGYVDRWTGTLTVMSDGNRLASGDAILAWPLPIHTGEAYGPLRGLVMTIMGVTLFSMAVTGIWLWLRKRRPNRKRRPG